MYIRNLSVHIFVDTGHTDVLAPSTRYLTAKGIIPERLKSLDNSNMPKSTKIAIRYVRADTYYRKASLLKRRQMEIISSKICFDEIIQRKTSEKKLGVK